MEYLRVTFDPTDIRDVIANGNIIGKTEDLLMLPTNFYHLRLSGVGYKPPEQKANVNGTTPEHPIVIVFTRDGAAVIGASDV